MQLRELTLSTPSYSSLQLGICREVTPYAQTACNAAPMPRIRIAVHLLSPLRLATRKFRGWVSISWHRPHCPKGVTPGRCTWAPTNATPPSPWTRQQVAAKRKISNAHYNRTRLAPASEDQELKGPNSFGDVAQSSDGRPGTTYVMDSLSRAASALGSGTTSFAPHKRRLAHGNPYHSDTFQTHVSLLRTFRQPCNSGGMIGRCCPRRLLDFAAPCFLQCAGVGCMLC